MKVNNIKYLIIVVFTLGVFSSCNDFLEVESINKVSPEGFVANTGAKENAVSAAYMLTNRAIAKQGAWAYHSDIRTGMTYPSGELFEIFKNQDLNSSNPKMETFRDWNRYYRAIGQCNYVIGELEKSSPEFLPDEEIGQAKGEMLYLRAYLHFYITLVWGDAPIVTKPGEEGPVTSSSKEDVLIQVLMDLDEAIRLLPDFILNDRGDISSSNSRRKATKPAALALLARVALEKGEYVKGILAYVDFETISDQTHFQLNDAGSITNVYNGASLENIFGLQNGEDFNSWNYNPYNSTMYIGANEVRFAITDSAIVKQIYELEDPRLDYNVEDENGALRVFKFYTSYHIVSRYGELILTAAELYHKAGNDTKALDLLNKIRVRSNLEALEELTESDLFDAIKAERVRELFAEGHSFFDYMRWGELAQRVEGISQDQIDAGITYWPISNENQGNFFSVSQNAYWN